MIFAPLILGFAAAGFDRYGLPRPKPGNWIVTISAPPPIRTRHHTYCVHSSDDLTNLVKNWLQDQEKADGGYDCAITITGAGKGKATCSRIATSQTAETTLLHLKWHAAIAKGGSNVRGDVEGYAAYRSVDPNQPRGYFGLPGLPFSETITGVFHGPCT